jgi:hypothetical protein
MTGGRDVRGNMDTRHVATALADNFWPDNRNTDKKLRISGEHGRSQRSRRSGVDLLLRGQSLDQIVRSNRFLKKFKVMAFGSRRFQHVGNGSVAGKQHNACFGTDFSDGDRRFNAVH